MNNEYADTQKVETKAAGSGVAYPQYIWRTDYEDGYYELNVVSGLWRLMKLYETSCSSHGAIVSIVRCEKVDVLS